MLRAIAAGIFFVVLLGGLSTQAGAITPEELPGRDTSTCGALYESIVKPDGSILALGNTGCEPQGGRTTLVQLTYAGRIDPGFSDGGVKVLPSQPPDSVIALMPAGPSDAVLATESSLSKFKADGSPDQEFGQGGEVDLSEVFEDPIYAAANQADGKIVVSGDGAIGAATLARFTASGELDDEFGGDGVVDQVIPAGVPLFSPQAIGFDSADRITGAAAGSGAGPVAMRLLEDGSLDTAFGPEDNGFTEFQGDIGSFQPSGPGLSIAADDDGAFRIYDVTYPAIYTASNVGYVFDADGLSAGRPVNHKGNGSGIFTELPDGGLASSEAAGRAMPSTFNLTRTYADGSPYTGFPTRTLELSPGSGAVAGVTYLPADNSLIATGRSYGFQCLPDCVNGSFMTIAKVNADTGRLDSSFGTQGSTVIPGNECAHVVAPSAGSVSGWTRCRLKAPGVKAKVRFRGGSGRNPGITGSATLYGAEEQPGIQTRTLTVKLPSRLRLRAGKVAPRLSATTNGTVPGDTSVTLRGRTIVIKHEPTWFPDNPDDVPPPGNPAVRIEFGLKRGAIKPLPRKLHRKALQFRFKGSLESDFTWYSPGSTTKVIKARAVGPRGR